MSVYAEPLSGPHRNGLPFRPYVYQGTGKDTLTPAELQALLDLDPDLPDRPGRNLRPCGTEAAYRRHLRLEGKPVLCELCLARERQRNDDRKAAAVAAYAEAVAEMAAGRARLAEATAEKYQGASR